MNVASPRLYLITPVVADTEAFRPALAEACRSGAVAAVLLRLAPADERTTVNRVKAAASAAHAAEAALILSDPSNPSFDLATVVARGGADGAHASGSVRLRELRDRLGPERSLGAGGLRTRHDAMEAGEIGVDYLMFGEPRADGGVPALGDVVERAGWWAEIFQIPCAAYAPSLDDLPALAATGAEFLAFGELVWTYPEGPAAAIAAARAALSVEAAA